MAIALAQQKTAGGLTSSKPLQKYGCDQNG
jgi:hypothetical protein